MTICDVRKIPRPFSCMITFSYIFNLNIFYNKIAGVARNILLLWVVLYNLRILSMATYFWYSSFIFWLNVISKTVKLQKSDENINQQKIYLECRLQSNFLSRRFRPSDKVWNFQVEDVEKQHVLLYGRGFVKAYLYLHFSEITYVIHNE